MGLPAIPTPAGRAATRELAASIVEAVTNDEPMPLGLTVYLTPHIGDVVSVEAVETLAMQLAQEIVALKAEADAQSECTSNAFDYLRMRTGDTQHLSNAEEIDVGNMDAEGNWIRRES